MNLQHHAKNQAFSSFCSSDKVNLKILQSDCLRAFWPRSQEPNFSQVWDLCKNTANNISFLSGPNSEKSNWLYFPINSKHIIIGPFLEQTFLSKNLALSHTTTHGPLTQCWVSEKNNEPIPRKLPNGRMEGWTDRPSFIGLFWPQPWILP